METINAVLLLASLIVGISLLGVTADVLTDIDSRPTKGSPSTR
jgi:hypothetical protein